MKMASSGLLTPRSFARIVRRFEGVYCFHYQGAYEYDMGSYNFLTFSQFLLKYMFVPL